MTNITLNIMEYSLNYLDIFASQRSALEDNLTEFYRFISMGKNNGHPHSWEYLSLVANYLTAYNELSRLNFFVKMNLFKPIN